MRRPTNVVKRDSSSNENTTYQQVGSLGVTSSMIVRVKALLARYVWLVGNPGNLPHHFSAQTPQDKDGYRMKQG